MPVKPIEYRMIHTTKQHLSERGLGLHAGVTNTADSFALMSGGVQWTAFCGRSSATVASTIAIVNRQYFYLAHIPLETRTIPGITPTPGVRNSFRFTTTSS